MIHGSFHTIRERNLKRIIPDHSKQSRSLALYKCAKGNPLAEITCNLTCTPQYEPQVLSSHGAMPELPEVETTKASLAPLLDQQVLSVDVRQSSLRWPIPADLNNLVGQRLIQLKRRSKYILAVFEQDTMLWHLGMSGSFRICEVGETLRKHDHLIIRFEDVELRYHDPRRFGCILWLDEYSQTKLIDTLGPEPLSADFNAEYLT